MTYSKKQIGDLGEELARDYLELQGYKILNQNVSNKYGEIDLIAKMGRHVYFVEIRTRMGGAYGSAMESLDKAKQGRIRRAVQAEWTKYPAWAQCIPFLSVIAIDEKPDGTLNIEFLPDAFE